MKDGDKAGYGLDESIYPGGPRRPLKALADHGGNYFPIIREGFHALGECSEDTGDGIGIEYRRLEPRPFCGKTIHLALQSISCCLCGVPKLLLHDFGKLRQQVFGGELAVGHKLIQLDGGHTHSLRSELKRAGETFAELPPQFFGLHLALADHLPKGEKSPLHIVLRKGKGGTGGCHGLENAVHVLFKR